MQLLYIFLVFELLVLLISASRLLLLIITLYFTTLLISANYIYFKEILYIDLFIFESIYLIVAFLLYKKHKDSLSIFELLYKICWMK